MKYVLSLLALVGALAVPAGATISPSARAAAASIKVPVNTERTNGDVTVLNGNVNGQHPTYSDSTGAATITPGGTNNPDSTATTVRCANGFVGQVRGIELGDRVEFGPSCNGYCEGTGGTVEQRAGGTIIYRNTLPAGPTEPSIQVHHNGGSITFVLPGQTVPVFGG